MRTDSENDVYNHYHALTTRFTQHARTTAQAHGHEPDIPQRDHLGEAFQSVFPRVTASLL